MNSARKHALLLLCLDTVTLLLVFNVLAWLRGIAAPGHWIGLPLLGPIAFLAVSVYLIDGYRERTDMLGLDYTSLHGIALVAATVATLLLTFAVIPSDYPLQGSRAVILLGFASALPITLGYRRFFYLRLMQRQRLRHLLFVGDRASCESFQEECLRRAFDRKIVFADAKDSPASPENARGLHLRPFAESLQAIRDGEISVEAIVLREAAYELGPSVSERLVELYFRGVPTYTLELFHRIYWRKIPLYRLNQIWLFQEGFQIAREPVFGRSKRLVDIVLSLLGLVLFGGPVGLAALAVRLEDGGVAFFRQRRIGKNRVPFTLVKLRTMRPAPPEGTLVPDKERITQVGRFLRASRLDEFPQLWNVLRGEMSLIGPRAEWDKLVERYEREIPCYHFRHLVKPGITGWAQVNHPYGATMENTLGKLEYDLYYIRHFSFLLDASIVLKTIHIVLGGKGH